MARVALVSPGDAALRAALITVAESGVVEFDDDSDIRDGVNGAGPAPPGDDAPPLIFEGAPDPDGWQRDGRRDLLAGEAVLRRYAAAAVRRDTVAALLGWCPAAEVPPLAERLARGGTALVKLPPPRGVDPPSLLSDTRPVRRAFTPLVQAYGTVPYADIDPTPLAAVAYLVMFGMMFGDAGHGALLVLAALLVRFGRSRRLAGLRRVWLLIAGAGLASCVFGVLFGEAFGPTGLPVLWLDPMREPVRLLAAGIGVGAVLLAGAYVVGVINRWREGHAPAALYAPSGLAGAALFGGLAALAAGLYRHEAVIAAPGAVVAVVGLALAAIGLFAASGGGGAGVAQTAVELFDLVIRLGANVVSFARLAAFGLTHAALGALVWAGTAALWGAGGLAMAAGVAVFLLGNLLTFGFEALVAGVQALRLEYYELFSRVFAGQGRPFRPWRVPVIHEVEAAR
jgi:V/A-type H+-transporting ATPase subunit I